MVAWRISLRACTLIPISLCVSYWTLSMSCRGSLQIWPGYNLLSDFWMMWEACAQVCLGLKQLFARSHRSYVGRRHFLAEPCDQIATCSGAGSTHMGVAVCAPCSSCTQRSPSTDCTPIFWAAQNQRLPVLRRAIGSHCGAPISNPVGRHGSRQ